MDMAPYKITKFEGVKSNQDGTEILLDFRLNKKRYRKKLHYAKTHGTKTDRIKLAQKALDNYKDEIAHSATLGDVGKMSINNYFDRVEASSNRGTAYQRALRNYYKKHIKDSVGDLLVKDVTPSHITALMQSLKSKNLTLSTQKKALECLVPIFKMAIDEEVIPKSPIRKIHLIKRDSAKEKKVILRAEEKYRKVYKQIFLTLHHNPKIMALVLLCFYGRRKTEAARLTWEDVDIEGRSYVIRAANSKVSQDMVFTLPDDVARIIAGVPRISEYIFYSEHNIKKPVSDIRHHIYKLRDDAEIPELTLHWMRNLAVSALSSMGVSALELSSMLGHTDPKTLRQYLTMQREATTKKIDKISQKALNSKVISV